MSVKVTFFFANQGYKWSEDHYNLSFTRPQDAQNAAYNLASFRAQCLGVGAVLREIRLSSVPANQLVQDVYFTNQLGGYTPQPPPFASSQFAAPAYSAILVRLSNPNGLHRNYYLAGAPAGLFSGVLNDDNFLVYVNVPYFYGTLKSLMSVLVTGGWGWRTRTGGTFLQTTGIVQSAGQPQQVGLVTQAALPGVVQGGQVLVRGWRRLNVRTMAPLTGVWTVASITQNAGPPATWTYWLLNSQGVGVNNFFSLGKIAPLVLTDTAYTNWVAEESVQRKRANPVAGRRGRAPIRG